MESNVFFVLIGNFTSGRRSNCSETLTKLMKCYYSSKKSQTASIKFQKKVFAFVEKKLKGASVFTNFVSSPTFSFAEVNVRIKFTTASPLQLSLKTHSLPMKCVNHIICNVGDLKLYAELFMSMHLCEELKEFQTLTLLLPCEFERKIQRLIV